MNMEVAGPSSQPSALLGLVDKAIDLQTPLVGRHIARIRRNRPDATPAEIVSRLNVEFRAATVGAGTAVGAAAAAPGFGTGVALALAGTETLGFLSATTLYVLARGEVQGVTLDDVERRRTLVLAVMLGDAGAAGVGRVAERSGQHWARQLVKAIPVERLVALNRVLGRNFVTKYGTKQGIVVLGKVVPFGIGAAIGGTLNAFFSQGVISASNKAFGPPSDSWPVDN